jgi:hypothetical protein
LIGLLDEDGNVLSAAYKTETAAVLAYEVSTEGYYYVVILYDEDSPYLNGSGYTIYIWWAKEN